MPFPTLLTTLPASIYEEAHHLNLIVPHLDPAAVRCNKALEVMTACCEHGEPVAELDHVSLLRCTAYVHNMPIRCVEQMVEVSCCYRLVRRVVIACE